MVGLGWGLDLVTLEVLANLNASVIPWFTDAWPSEEESQGGDGLWRVCSRNQVRVGDVHGL